MTYRQPNSRLEELLSAVVFEYENTKKELSFRYSKDDNDVKVSTQTKELQSIKQVLSELELSHTQIKDAYEREIYRLKSEISARDSQLSQAYRASGAPLPPPPVVAAVPPPQVAANTSLAAATPVQTPLPDAAVPAPAPVSQAPQAQQAPQAFAPVPTGPPPFLTKLDPDAVANEFKKQTKDFYVLFNPELPRNTEIELLHTFEHKSVVCCVHFSSDGRYLATGSDKSTHIYDSQTGELVASLVDEATEAVSKEANLYIRSVCFSPDGKFLATGAEDKLIRIWDLESKKVVKYLKGHDQDIYSLCFFPDGSKLVSGSGDRTVKIWNLSSGISQLTFTIEDGVTTVAVSPDGRLIAAGSLDKTVRIWDSVNGFLVHRIDSEESHSDSVYSVAFAHNGQELISGSLDTTVKLWSLAGTPARCLKTFVGHKDFVLSVAGTPGDDYVLSGSKDRGVIFWDKKGNAKLMLQGHSNSVISVSVSKGGLNGGVRGGMFATGSGDCKARLWRWVNY